MMTRLIKNLLYHCPWLFTDKKYLQLIFPLRAGYKLNLENPETFNEKLQWLKLYDRNDRYTSMVDKSQAKEIAAAIIGEEHIIPTIGVYDKVRDIPWETLPGQFVLKCTHDSGGLVICRDKNKFDRQAACNKLSKALSKNFYWNTREWPYKNVSPCILAEPYMGELVDYKWFCFNGKAEVMFIATDRNKEGEETKFDFFDRHFNHLPFTNGHPNAPICPSQPECWNEMIVLAEKLSAGMRQIRIDFYQIGGKVYFGEFTFSHWSGFKPFVPAFWDRELGKMIQL